MTDFADLADGGRHLASVLGPALANVEDAILVPAIPNGVPVVAGIRASGVARCADLPVLGLPVRRSDAGVVIEPVDGLAGRTAIVVDDGVETGTVARAAAGAIRASGAQAVILAVPVCPREALATLQHLYDDVVAPVRPLARRALAWHYADFDTIDETTAARVLATMHP